MSESRFNIVAALISKNAVYADVKFQLKFKIWC